MAKYRYWDSNSEHCLLLLTCLFFVILIHAVNTNLLAIVRSLPHAPMPHTGMQEVSYQILVFLYLLQFFLRHTHGFDLFLEFFF